MRGIMNKLKQDDSKICNEQHSNAKATARLIHYAARETQELGLRECSLLLHFIVDAICMKFDLRASDVGRDDAHQ
jgi:hypothetical protein